MCLGLGNGFVPSKENNPNQELKLESFKSHVCDHICRFPEELKTQDELDAVCEDCILEKITNIEIEGV